MGIRHRSGPGERSLYRVVTLIAAGITVGGIASCATAPPPAETPQACLSMFFEGMPEERVTRVERGTREIELLGAEQSKQEPFGLTITDGREPALLLRISYFADGEMFRIDRAVDSLCRPARTVRNADRPGEGATLQNWDIAEVKAAGATYEVRLGADEGTIALNHVTRQ